MRSVVEETQRYDQLLDKIDVPLITRYIPSSVIKAVIQSCNAQEKRLRRLPTWLIVLLCILRGIFAQESLSSVWARLCFVPCLKVDWNFSKLPGKSALCRARYRVGARPFSKLFQQICQPISTPSTPGAYAFGYQLVAIDSSKESVADSESNAIYFGRHNTKEGRRDAAFPHCQTLLLSECSSHVVFDAAMTPYKADMNVYFRRLTRSIDAQMLVMLDRGLVSYKNIEAVLKQNAQFIAPARSDMKLIPLKYFYDGSYLAHIKYWNRGYAPKSVPPIVVRVIPYTLDDPIRNPEGRTYRMMTSLLAPSLCPAKKVVAIYHQRWEVELAIDEMDTHQRLTWTPVRSQKPVGVIQEFYSLLLAYFVICCLRYESADAHDLSPQHLSFVNTLRLIQHVTPITQLAGESMRTRLWQVMLEWQRYFQLPKRDCRTNPRVVRRKRNKFRRKKPGEQSQIVPEFMSVLRIVQRA